MTHAENICATLAEAIGQPLPPSAWVEVTQARITAFAGATDDHQFIHIDPERAARETPFGGTIAHGFLTLSLASRFAYEVVGGLDGQTASLNYGFERIRFLAPVLAGARIRGRFTLSAAVPRTETAVLMTHALTIEIEGSETPALVADWLSLITLAS